ncbi:MAG: hypothetical protein JWR61_2041 [Ferruginibacter sp.]|nr:hypothetical protein [Ferruginibacter sp.]
MLGINDEVLNSKGFQEVCNMMPNPFSCIYGFFISSITDLNRKYGSPVV